MSRFNYKKTLKLVVLILVFVLLLACRNKTVRVNKTMFGLSDNFKAVYDIEGKVKYSSDGSEGTFTVGENTDFTLEYTGNPDSMPESVTVKRLFDKPLVIENTSNNVFFVSESPDAEMLLLFEENEGYIILIEWDGAQPGREFLLMR